MLDFCIISDKYFLTKEFLPKGIKAWEYLYKQCMKGKVPPLNCAGAKAGIHKGYMLNFLFALHDRGYEVGQPDEGLHPAKEYLKELYRARKELREKP